MRPRGRRGVQNEMDYIAPQDIDEAVTALKSAAFDAHVLAGGTDLIVQMRSGRKNPSLLVDIKKIPETTMFERGPDGCIRIGAATPIVKLSTNSDFAATWPGVLESARLIGSEQVQGRATIGGNLCNGSPAADTVPALLCAEAFCSVAGSSGVRTVPIDAILKAPGRTSLDAGEFVVSIHLPRPPNQSSLKYIRFIPRTEMDIAVVGAAVSLTVDDKGICTAARVALGAVAPTAILVPSAAEAMLGSDLGDDVVKAVEAAARDASEPIDDMRGTAEYRTHIAGVLAGRALRAAASSARGQQ